MVKLENMKKDFQDDFSFVREQMMRAELRYEDRIKSLIKQIEKSTDKMLVQSASKEA